MVDDYAYEDPYFSNDFRRKPQMYSFTNEYDVQSNFLPPKIKISEKVGYGKDDDGSYRVGYIPTGFPEYNTEDLQTGVLETETEIAFVNIASVVEMMLYDMHANYGINTKNSFEFIRGRIGTFMSITKSKKGKLLDALTTKRFIQHNIESDMGDKLAKATNNSSSVNELV
ncbi:hypothetical protein KBH77_04555 [Patescibacteria group bacterium]|nr:hypothetical protein [Patescibacteria group bacterium]